MINKTTLLVCVIGISAVNCFAEDGCTGQVNGKVAALEAALESEYVDGKQKQKIKEELTLIEEKRKRLTDCEVRKGIPELSNSDKVIDAASAAIKKP